MVRLSSAADDLNSANLELVHRAAAERRDKAFEMISNFHREFGSLVAPYMAMAMQLPADVRSDAPPFRSHRSFTARRATPFNVSGIFRCRTAPLALTAFGFRS